MVINVTVLYIRRHLEYLADSDIQVSTQLTLLQMHRRGRIKPSVCLGRVRMRHLSWLAHVAYIVFHGDATQPLFRQPQVDTIL